MKAEAIEAFDESLGVGKESDVYDTLTSYERRVAPKFHHLGRTSFKKLNANETIPSNTATRPIGTIDPESQPRKITLP
jgi:RIO-like serine/threonine protein kinase